MVANADSSEKELLERFRAAYAEAKKQPHRFPYVEELLLGAIQVLEKEITNA